MHTNRASYFIMFRISRGFDWAKSSNLPQVQIYFWNIVSAVWHEQSGQNITSSLTSWKFALTENVQQNVYIHFTIYDGSQHLNSSLTDCQETPLSVLTWLCMIKCWPEACYFSQTVVVVCGCHLTSILSIHRKIRILPHKN